MLRQRLAKMQWDEGSKPMLDKLLEDEVEDGNRKADPVDHLILLGVLLLINLTVMSRCYQVIHEGQDVANKNMLKMPISMKDPAMTR